MKKDLSVFIGLELFLLSILLLFTFSSCSSSNVTDVVCDYGSVVCDVSQTLCTEIPNVPPEVCTYLDLACNQLDVLCANQDSTGSSKYQNALIKLQTITEKLKQWKQVRDKTK